jgi:uncharacterized repeat protein (TIGR03803 family)
MRKYYLTKCFRIIIILSLATQTICAQYKKLHDFRAVNDNTLMNPQYTQFVSSGSTLYGMTSYGGYYGYGTIFKINMDGTGYKKLHDFFWDGYGYIPYGSLTLVGDSLYGMTYDGGANAYGTLFKINIDGSGYQDLLDFDWYDKNKGAYPCGSLILVGDSLYGMTSFAGTNNDGTIFKIHKNGNGFHKVLDFDGTKGSNPYGTLLLVGDSLYGMTSSGGSYGEGLMFRIHRNCTGYYKILDFDGTSKGANPHGSLTLIGDSLYGMTLSGGNTGVGALFRIHKRGTGFKKLLDFGGNNKGSSPYGSLSAIGDTLYGMTSQGGSNNLGVIFKINKNGNGYQNLIDFDGSNKGSSPFGSLFFSGNLLYGMTSSGGTFNNGVVFRINSSGTGFTKLIDCFNAPEGNSPLDLISDGSFLFGVTLYGGMNGLGVIYKTNMDGAGYQKLFDFNESNGSNPGSALTLIGDSLYGTTTAGGVNNYGVVYRIARDGGGFQKLLEFNGTNGKKPYCSLTSVDGLLYGTTQNGGVNDDGIIFKINKNGTQFSKLIDFDANNGYNPNSLILIGDSLYGMTLFGGADHSGVIFRMNKNSSGFKKIHDFSSSTEGGMPFGSLTLVGDSLYGMTYFGGTYSSGTIFKTNKSGSKFQKIHDFEVSTGYYPYGSLTISGDSLFGTTSGGGAKNKGTIFKINVKTKQYQKVFDFDSTALCRSTLFLSNKTLYGACPGGADGSGFIFQYGPGFIQSTNLIFSNVQTNQININFTNGNGDKRLVFICQGNTGTPTLVNGQTYTANTIFGQGSQAGTGWYCVANGNLSGNITITGLTQNATYRIMVLEYNGVAGSEQYLNSITTNLANQTTGTVNTQTEKASLADVQVFPNPASYKLNIVLPVTNGFAQIINLSGQIVYTTSLNSQSEELNISNLARGMYIIRIIIKNQVIVKKVEFR